MTEGRYNFNLKLHSVATMVKPCRDFNSYLNMYHLFNVLSKIPYFHFQATKGFADIGCKNSLLGYLLSISKLNAPYIYFI